MRVNIDIRRHQHDRNILPFLRFLSGIDVIRERTMKREFDDGFRASSIRSCKVIRGNSAARVGQLSQPAAPGFSRSNLHQQPISFF
jgi:hypothetical protein